MAHHLSMPSTNHMVQSSSVDISILKGDFYNRPNMPFEYNCWLHINIIRAATTTRSTTLFSSSTYNTTHKRTYFLHDWRHIAHAKLGQLPAIRLFIHTRTIHRVTTGLYSPSKARQQRHYQSIPNAWRREASTTRYIHLNHRWYCVVRVVLPRCACSTHARV
jgi:hypothetical protein